MEGAIPKASLISFIGWTETPATSGTRFPKVVLATRAQQLLCNAMIQKPQRRKVQGAPMPCAKPSTHQLPPSFFHQSRNNINPINTNRPRLKERVSCQKARWLLITSVLSHWLPLFQIPCTSYFSFYWWFYFIFLFCSPRSWNNLTNPPFLILFLYQFCLPFSL